MGKRVKIPNKLQIIGVIDEAAFAKFSQELSVFEAAGAKSVIVELSSSGGIASDALSFYSRIRLSPCDIIIIAYGLVASAAVLILVAGDKRLMTKEAWVMTHEDQVNEFEGTVTELERHSKRMRVTEDQWNILLAKHTKLTKVGWDKINLKDTYFSADKCLQYDIVDEII